MTSPFAAARVFFFFFFLHGRGAASDVALAPFLSSLFNTSCDGVQCGKGTCRASTNSSFLGLPLGSGFSCECDPGWARFFLDDSLKFLPCVIPKCNLSYSCAPEAAPPAPSAPPPHAPLNWDLFSICSLKMCGEGECVKTSTLSHRCDCKSGYSNLLNMSTFPCYPSCGIGADCSKLGIRFPGTPSVSPPPNASGGTYDRSKEKLRLALLSLLLIFLARV